VDVFVARLNLALTNLIQATYLGGNGDDLSTSLAVRDSELYVAGDSQSTNFPGVAGGAQSTYGGVKDAFVSRLSTDLLASPMNVLNVTDVSLSEGNSGSKVFTFTVSLSPASASTVTVNYATANGTATVPNDYTTTSGTLTFTPGRTSKTVTVKVKGNAVVEPNETFFVNLSGAVGATIFDPQGVGTIRNDD
jgi:hypothetical protein